MLLFILQSTQRETVAYGNKNGTRRSEKIFLIHPTRVRRNAQLQLHRVCELFLLYFAIDNIKSIYLIISIIISSYSIQEWKLNSPRSISPAW